MDETSYLEVNLASLDANVQAIRCLLAPGCDICAIVKADGYGLGALPVAKRLAQNRVAMFGLYSLQQATELAVAGVTTPLLVLMPVFELSRRDRLYRTAVEGRLHLTIHSLDQARAVEAIGQKFGCAMPIHIEVDSGMSRCGMHFDDAAKLIAGLDDRRYLKLAGIFTHTHSSDQNPQATAEQHDRFATLLRETGIDQRPDVQVHFAGTYAMRRDPNYHHALVRVGLALTGYGNEELPGPQIDAPLTLQPVVRWVSHLVHVLGVPAGSDVGYGATYTTQRDGRLGLIPIGYADGYPVSLSNNATVRVGAERQPAPIRGKVNMDQIIVDLTELPDAAIGDEVEIYADDPAAPNALPNLAEAAGTHCYELLCRLSPRIARRYVTVAGRTGGLDINTHARHASGAVRRVS